MKDLGNKQSGSLVVIEPLQVRRSACLSALAEPLRVRMVLTAHSEHSTANVYLQKTTLMGKLALDCYPVSAKIVKVCARICYANNLEKIVMVVRRLLC
jgi:hypothetical protein